MKVRVRSRKIPENDAILKLEDNLVPRISRIRNFNPRCSQEQYIQLTPF